MYALENDECSERAGNLSRLVANTTICAVLGRGHGPCNGDSGGPLVANHQLVGIASWTVRPCGGGGPTGYARVSELINWVFEITGIAAQ